LSDWFPAEVNASVVMLWADSTTPGGQTVRTLGLPPISLVDLDGMIVARRASTHGPDL
jgi:CRISPR-associated protein Cas2